MSLSVSVVMFAYNESAHLVDVVEDTLKQLEQHCDEYQLVLIDDGSTDDTPSIIEQLSQTHAQLVTRRHEHNRGIGEAVHTGYETATKDFICILPADGQIRMSEMVTLFEPAMSGADLVLGRYRQRQEVDALHRMVLSTGLRILMRLLLGVDRQIDSAFLFRRAILSEMPLTSRSFFVNLELPIRIIRGPYRVEEVPITVYPRISGHSKVVKMTKIALVARDLLKLRVRLIKESLTRRKETP